MPSRSGRPLFIVDCDEVILHQAGPVSEWLAAEHGIDQPLSGRGACYRLDGASVPASELGRLMRLFAETQLHRQTLVEGAKEGLAALAAFGDVVILTNIPAIFHKARVEQLARHGIRYHVQCNSGLKGSAVVKLIECYQPPSSTFIDDHPTHHDDVARCAPTVRCVQLIGDPDLARVLRHPSAPHQRIIGWTRQLFSSERP